MSNVNFLMTDDGALSIFTPVNQYLVEKSHENYKEIIVAINEDNIADLERLINVQKTMRDYVTSTGGDGSGVVVRDGVIYYNGEVMDNNITKRTKAFMDAGLKFEHMVEFLKNVCENPSFTSKRELFKFLDHHQLPITDDGCFLAYKRIRDDWTDDYTGKISNAIGAKPWMPRNEVDDNTNQDCSHGFHAGTINFVRNFGSSGRVVVVKINPKDVVSVPRADSEKLRCNTYEVMYEFTGELHAQVYKGDGKSPVDDDDYEEPDDDHDDDDDDDDDYED